MIVKTLNVINLVVFTACLALALLSCVIILRTNIASKIVYNEYCSNLIVSPVRPKIFNTPLNKFSTKVLAASAPAEIPVTLRMLNLVKASVIDLMKNVEKS